MRRVDLSVQMLRLIDDMIHLCINEYQSAAVSFVDFEKAFDMVEWSFVVHTLMKSHTSSHYLIASFQLASSSYKSGCQICKLLSQCFK